MELNFSCICGICHSDEFCPQNSNSVPYGPERIFIVFRYDIKKPIFLVDRFQSTENPYLYGVAGHYHDASGISIHCGHCLYL